MRHASFPFAAVVCLVLAATATFADEATKAADDPLLNERVLLKPGAKAYIGKDEFDVRRIHWPAKVTQVDGAWLWVGRAWIPRSDALTKEQGHKYFSDQIRRQPTAAAYRNRALCWPVDESDKALQDLEAALRLDPHDALTLFQRADAYLQGVLDKTDKWWGEAGDSATNIAPIIAGFTSAIKADDSLAIAYERRGVAWLLVEQFANSRRDLTVALRLDPDKVSSLTNRAIAAMMLGLLGEALADYDAAVVIDPNRKMARSSRGYARLLLQEIEGAIEDFEAAIKLDPNEINWGVELAWILAACPEDTLRNGARAKELALQVCQGEDGRTAKNVDILAMACAASGEFDLALQYANEALELASWDAPDSEFKGRVQKRIKFYEERKPWSDERLQPASKQPPSESASPDA